MDESNVENLAAVEAMMKLGKMYTCCWLDLMSLSYRIRAVPDDLALLFGRHGFDTKEKAREVLDLLREAGMARWELRDGEYFIDLYYKHPHPDEPYYDLALEIETVEIH